ncbi:MAG TPA: response regulator [Verrucomicrobiae bacterium]|nr:response regulator [Verrucomicrobiae bacterium]
MKSPASEKNHRILVIDDNRAIHDDFRKILGGPTTESPDLAEAETALFGERAPTLQPARFQIDSAYQGQEGLAVVQKSVQLKQPYAVAFVDIRMPPGWDGVETTRKLWEVDPDLQVVICTAHSDYSWEDICREIGNSDRFLVLKKPFDTVEVLQLANALTEKWWLQQEVKRQVDELELKVAERTKELREANGLLKKEVVERTEAEDSLRIKTEQLQAITDAMVAFLQSGDECLPSEILLRNALQQTGSECGFVGLVTDGPSLRILAQAGLGWEPTKDGKRLEIINFKNLFGGVITSGQAVVSNEPGADSPSAEGLPIGTTSLQRFLAVPVLSGTQVVGMISVANRPDAYAGREQNKIGVLARVAGVLLDNYRRKEREAILEKQLRQSQKVEAIGRLAGGVAHDFNNILTAILGYSDLLLLRMKADDSLHGSVEEIRNAAQRAAALTRQLLAFSRKQILEPKVVNLNDIVLDLSKMLRRMIGEDIELITHGAWDLGRTKVDPGQIEQVIINLAINARDAMPHGGKLTIETANVALDRASTLRLGDVAPGKYVRVAVSDTGTGMTPEVQARLFEPFFTTKAEGKGTGLGLAMCYGIVKQSGGHITVYSEPGHGTVFKIYLPRIEEAAAPEAKQDQSGDLPQGKETILLVEDEAGLRKLTKLVLQDLGYTILEAANGCEALRIAKERDGRGFDLVFTDVVMPQMGGKELADHIHSLRPDAKVLFTSGYTEDAIVDHGVLNDDVAFLHKPYTPNILACKLREVLDT